MAEETWRDDPELIAAVDRLLNGAAPELDTIMSRMTADQSAIQQAQGNMSFALIFCLGLFSCHYASARKAGESEAGAWEIAFAGIANHPLTQQIVAKAMSHSVDQAVGVNP